MRDKERFKGVNSHSLEIRNILHDRTVSLNALPPKIKHFIKLLKNIDPSGWSFNLEKVRIHYSIAGKFAMSNDVFGFKDSDHLMSLIRPTLTLKSNLKQRRYQRKDQLGNLERADKVGSVQTTYDRYKKIVRLRWRIDFGHTSGHSQAWSSLIENISPSPFEFECGAFNNKIVYMTGLRTLTDHHEIKKVENKVIVYAKLISEDEHGLKVFKVKWIRPINKHPKYVNESGYIFSHDGINITAAKNVKAEQRIETVAQKMMTEQYGKTAMTRINDLAGKPVPYYLYPIIIDYISKESYSGTSAMDTISHFRFTVFMTSVMNEIKVTKETAEAEVEAAEAEVAAEIKVEVAKSVKESIAAAGLTDVIDKINARKEKAA